MVYIHAYDWSSLLYLQPHSFSQFFIPLSFFFIPLFLHPFLVLWSSLVLSPSPPLNLSPLSFLLSLLFPQSPRTTVCYLSVWKIEANWACLSVFFWHAFVIVFDSTTYWNGISSLLFFLFRLPYECLSNTDPGFLLTLSGYFWVPLLLVCFMSFHRRSQIHLCQDFRWLPQLLIAPGCPTRRALAKKRGARDFLTIV